MMERLFPGTVIPREEAGSPFSRLRPLIRAAAGLTLGQVCAITGLEASTVQNWVKRGFVPHPVQKKYHERQLARILLISALRDGMPIDAVGELMALVNGNADDEADDLLPEEALYDCFCRLTAEAGEAADGERLAALARQLMQEYDPPEEAAGRLSEAMTVMYLAYTAGQYRREAEARFRLLKENTQEDRTYGKENE